MQSFFLITICMYGEPSQQGICMLGCCQLDVNQLQTIGRPEGPAIVMYNAKSNNLPYEIRFRTEKDTD